jgi:uncharacterized protein
MTFFVIARIHWQALRLLAKRVPFVTKPQAPDQALSRGISAAATSTPTVAR